MSGLVDISVPLRESTPRWPGSVGFRRSLALSHSRGDGVDASIVTADVHTATHVDAPRHFVPGGGTMESMSLETLVGRACVVDFGSTPVITPELLERHVPSECTRLLARTRNSGLWEEPDFFEDFVALSKEAAEWVVHREIRLIGIDYMSIQRFHDGPEVHQILLGAGVVILEGIDLTHVAPGDYELYCFPLLIPEAEGAPARAALRPL